MTPLYFDSKAKAMFISAIFVALRKARNFRSHLVRSKIFLLEPQTGYRKCKNARCFDMLGSKNVKQTDAITGHVTKETLKNNRYFNCDNTVWFI